MDEISTRAVIIGVGITVTIIIVSIIVVMFFQMSEIYGIVATTDNSIKGAFDDIVSMYNGRTMTGLGLLNTIKKYEDDEYQNILVEYPGYLDIREEAENTGKREVTLLKEKMETGSGYTYEQKYNVIVDDYSGDKVKIIFTNM